MAMKMSITSLIMLVVLMQWNRGAAQSGCTMAIVSLSPCVNYITGNSSTPSSSCCSRLSSVVDSQPQCLCSLLKGGASNFGIVVNQTLALALPGACNVQTPPVSRCDEAEDSNKKPSKFRLINFGITAANGPAAPAPADSPSESPVDDELPEVPSTETDIPSGAGSKTVPRTDGSNVGGSQKGATFSFVGTLVLIIASSLSFS